MEYGFEKCWAADCRNPNGIIVELLQTLWIKEPWKDSRQALSFQGFFISHGERNPYVIRCVQTTSLAISDSQLPLSWIFAAAAEIGGSILPKPTWCSSHGNDRISLKTGRNHSEFAWSEGMPMDVKARILTIRLMETLQKDSGYAQRLGIQIKMRKAISLKP